MDYLAIKAEITKPAYAGLTDTQIATALNALTVPGPDRLVPIIEVMDYLRANGLWLPIKAAAATNTAAAAAVDLNDDVRAQTIDMNLPIMGQMLAALVSASLLTQAQSDAIVALKSTSSPFARLGDETISADSIAFARSLP